MAHYDIYREQLAALYHGHALWEPDPAGLYDQVAVGDAGYIRQGHFHKLFNILLPADDPSHDLLGVPDGFEPLQIGSTHLRILALPKGDYHSFSVTASDVAVGAQIAAGPVPVTGSFQVSFSCSKKQGAVLSLPFDARREDTFRKGDFRAYIVAHCEQWLTFAQHHGLDVERMEELILVTGCDRTQPWALAAFNSTSMSAGIAFDVSVLSGAASAPTLKWKIVQQDGQSTPYNYGPRPEQEPRSNQCVFIRGYRAKKRPIQRLPVKILAAAEPRPDDDGRGDDGKDASEVEAEDISDFPVYHDPLLPILDFLLDECPQAETVVVHDDDLMHIVGQDVLSADVVRTYLHDVAKTSPSRSCPGGLTVELSDILGDIPARANPTSGSLPFPPRPRRSIMHRRNVSAPTPLYIEPSKNRAPALQKPRKQPPQPAAPGAGHPHSPSSHTPQLTSSSGSLRRTPAKAIPRSLPPVPSDRPATPTYGSICGDAPPPYGPTTPLSSIREAGQRPKGPRSRLPRMAHNILHRTHMYDDNAIQDSLGLLESPDPPTSIFITEPIALKGLTLEAARWTFPPEHMQAVVSKAVRQSADTSSLRLLPPAVINGELPEALLHLDARQRALKEEHILRSRRRDTLFASLLSGHGANADTLKEQMEELQAVSEDIDRTAAELFRLLDQVAQLRQLAETHSRSALALALRILNASALHSSTEAQTLRSKVATQEAVVHEMLGPQAQSMQGGSRVSPITPTSVPPAWKPRRRGSWST